MMTLVIGGSKCGKSHFAESLFSQFPHRKIYLATMMPFGSEAQIAIDRHRQSRLGKGFETMERFTDLHTLSLPSPCGVLLECLGNLCANELFCDAPAPDPVEKIMAGICHLRSTAMQCWNDPKNARGTSSRTVPTPARPRPIKSQGRMQKIRP